MAVRLDGEMRIQLKATGTLTGRLPSGSVDVPDGTTTRQLLESLGVPMQHCLYVINGEAVSLDRELREGDRVVPYPPLAGGYPGLRYLMAPMTRRMSLSDQPSLSRC